VGEVGRQVLPDGSHVILGAGSHMSVVFFRNRRVVSLLAGDAVFEVVQDPQRPFVVEGGLARATVLGTRFAVNRGADRSRVSVERGRVRVENARGTELVVLEAGGVAEVAQDGLVRRIAAPASDGFAWQRGTLVFDNASLQEIATCLSRYRRVPVRAEGRSAQRITAVVQSVDIEHFLQSLPTFAAVRIEHRDGATLLISP
jgi:transmembrane sensor